MRKALILAGPTCSGKSALALGLAKLLGGTVINADSMQVYRELRILTARPSPEEETLVPHRLYGVRPAAEPGNAAWWRATALAEMEACPGLPIICGGTGLYLSSLTAGIAGIPEPDPACRAEARALLAELGAPALHARLAEHDPKTAFALRPSDGQRIARAWEVWRSTGQGLSVWQTMPAPDSGWRFRAILLDPPRDALRQSIATRFTAMLEQGAIAEVQSLLALGLDPALPAMRAHGVPELSAYLRGEILLSEAQRRACLATGQYTKRQATWFHNRPWIDKTALHTIHARVAGLEQFSESETGVLLNFIQDRG